MKRHRKSQPTLPLRELDVDSKDSSYLFSRKSFFLAAFLLALLIFLAHLHGTLKQPAPSNPIQALGTTDEPLVPVPTILLEFTQRLELNSLQLNVAPVRADPAPSQALEHKEPVSILNPIQVPSAPEPAKEARMALPPLDMPFEVDHELLAKIARGGGTQADRERLSIKMSGNDLEAKKRAGKDRARAAASMSQELPHVGNSNEEEFSSSSSIKETRANTEHFTKAAPQREPQRPSVISDQCSVTASTMGNLGPPSVVTSDSTMDPLRDRWQAASDLNGTPIPGPQWLAIDLKQTCIAERFAIDWETAFANVRLAPLQRVRVEYASPVSSDYLFIHTPSQNFIWYLYCPVWYLYVFGCIKFSSRCHRTTWCKDGRTPWVAMALTDGSP